MIHCSNQVKYADFYRSVVPLELAPAAAHFPEWHSAPVVPFKIASAAAHCPERHQTPWSRQIATLTSTPTDS